MLLGAFVVEDIASFSLCAVLGSTGAASRRFVGIRRFATFGSAHPSAGVFRCDAHNRQKRSSKNHYIPINITLAKVACLDIFAGIFR